MASRIIIRLELTKEAKTRLRKVGKRFGMTQLSLTDRMAVWFESQSKQVQQAVLAGSEDQATQMFLKEKAGSAAAAT
ncbi:MAG TPA: hypothetical protein VFE58_07555 [Tepidisphaeraceae bacterium]|jgi:hypothetical protein|nr:hypothetical protein [Tepidisphaeraceae bacterium]